MEKLARWGFPRSIWPRSQRLRITDHRSALRLIRPIWPAPRDNDNNSSAPLPMRISGSPGTANVAPRSHQLHGSLNSALRLLSCCYMAQTWQRLRWRNRPEARLTSCRAVLSSLGRGGGRRESQLYSWSAQQRPQQRESSIFYAGFALALHCACVALCLGCFVLAPTSRLRRSPISGHHIHIRAEIGARGQDDGCMTPPVRLNTIGDHTPCVLTSRRV